MKLGIGIIGCGRVATEMHLPVLLGLSSARVVALADMDEQRLRQVADRFGVEQRYPDYRQLIDDEAVELVAICVPVSQRTSMVQRAFSSGKHVFVEKPLGLSVTELESIVENAQSAAGGIAVGHNLRCHRLVEKAVPILRNEDLGRLDVVQSVWTTDLGLNVDLPEWRGRRDSGGGVVFEIGIHHFDLVQHLLADKVVEVWGRRRSGSEDASAVVMSATTDRGVLLTSVFSQETLPRNEFDFTGQEARLNLNLYRFDGLSLTAVGAGVHGIGSRARSAVATLKSLPTAMRLARTGGDFLGSYRRQWQRLLPALRNGTAVPCSVRDAANAALVAIAVEESIDSGRPVAVGHL